MPQCVVGVLLLELVDEEGSFGARTDDRHVADEHVNELRDLVDAQATQVFAHRGHARVVGSGQHGAGLFFGHHTHRTEFEDLELAPVLSDAGLTVENRTGRAGFHQDRGDEHNWRRDNQGD